MLITTDGEKWRYLAVKSLPALLRRITSNHNGDFFCLNCFHSCSSENRLKKHETVCNDHDYCHVEMPNEDNKSLNYNHGEKSLKVPFIIYADLECLLEKMQNNVKIISKNLTKREKISLYLLVTQGIQFVHLTQQKMNVTSTEMKTKKLRLMKNKKFATYIKKNFVLMKMIKIHLNYTIKSEIIVITQENLKELLIVFAI